MSNKELKDGIPEDTSGVPGENTGIEEEINAAMDKIAGDIRVLAENYPQLKADNTFVQLQKAIVDVEEHLQAARRLYNSNVNRYNSKIVVFPNSIVANGMGAVKRELFVAEEYKRQDVKMQF